MAAAFSARFRDELPPLTADLPPAGTAAPAAGAPGAWRGVFAALVVLSLLAAWRWRDTSSSTAATPLTSPSATGGEPAAGRAGETPPVAR